VLGRLELGTRGVATQAGRGQFGLGRVVLAVGRVLGVVGRVAASGFGAVAVARLVQWRRSVRGCLAWLWHRARGRARRSERERESREERERREIREGGERTEEGE
jgi:hypothetical protein